MTSDTLSYRGVVSRQHNQRSFADERVRVLRVVAEYAGPDGEIYRKSFEQRERVNMEPIVPVYGTHDQLNAAKIQWQTEGHRSAVDLR